eukprot:s122_g22.t1
MNFRHVLPVLVAHAASSLLHIPAREGRTSEVADLLDRGGLRPWINYRTDDGQTPVMAASLAGHAEVVELLIQRGCNVTIGDKEGYKPLDAATWTGHPEVVEVLMKYSSPERLHLFHSDGFAPIHRACWGDSHWHSKAVQVLLEAGVEAELQAKNGTTCVQLARRQETRDLLNSHIAQSHATAKTEL